MLPILSALKDDQITAVSQVLSGFGFTARLKMRHKQA
jgi:hypothetical protein